MAFLLYAVVLMVSVLLATYARSRLELWPRLRDKVQLRPGTSSKSKDGAGKPDDNHETNRSSQSAWTIEPLSDFDWNATAPLKLRPFKPTYNITMAIQSSTPSELVLMDSNYLSRVTARRRLLAEHASAVHGAIPAGHAPIRELYSYLLGTYLPTRYPTMFELIRNPDSQTTATETNYYFRNKVTGIDSPLHPAPSDPLEMLRILGETVEDDMFLLLRDPAGDGNGNGNGNRNGNGGEHRAVAFVCCHPSGFAPAGKLGKRLAEIHVPVPAYEKIGASMERYFARLEAGRAVKRMNWSIQTHPNLYAPSGNHVHVGDEVEEAKTADVEESRFRVELQTLTRLPDTQAILFSFKTYLYSLEDIKAEGLGPHLAEAIEGLKAGNAPGMWVYKGGVRWGRAMCEYLRA